MGCSRKILCASSGQIISTIKIEEALHFKVMRGCSRRQLAVLADIEETLHFEVDMR
jgi:hypothetical protein